MKKNKLINEGKQRKISFSRQSLDGSAQTSEIRLFFVQQFRINQQLHFLQSHPKVLPAHGAEKK